jgi:hypothetical protein
MPGARGTAAAQPAGPRAPRVGVWGGRRLRVLPASPPPTSTTPPSSTLAGRDEPTGPLTRAAPSPLNPLPTPRTPPSFGPAYAREAGVLADALAAAGGVIKLHDKASGAPLVSGQVAGVTTDAALIVPDADLIIISTSAPTTEAIVDQVGPYMRPDQLVVFLMVGAGWERGYGGCDASRLGARRRRPPPPPPPPDPRPPAAAQGIGSVCFQQLQAASARAGLPAPPVYAATKTLPWACRISAPGCVAVGGAKGEVGVGLAPDASPLARAMLPPLLGGLFPPVKFLVDGALDATCLPYEFLAAVVRTGGGLPSDGGGPRPGRAQPPPPPPARSPAPPSPPAAAPPAALSTPPSCLGSGPTGTARRSRSGRFSTTAFPARCVLGCGSVRV